MSKTAKERADELRSLLELSERTPREKEEYRRKIEVWEKETAELESRESQEDKEENELGLGMEEKWALLKYHGPDKVIPASEAREALAKEKISPVRFDTGIPSLDNIIKGIRGGELIVVGGKPKNGKTLLAQTITSNIFKTGTPPLWFSYEVPVRQFLDQMPPECDFLIPASLDSNHIRWLEARMLEAFLKYRCRIAVIDHLHYLVDMARIRNPSLEIGAIVRELKRLAIRYNFAIILISHVRGVEPGAEVTEDHLRDSAFTKAEADSTWIVTRLFDKGTDEATNVCRVSVRNHRRTGVMGKSIKLIKSGPFFEELKEELDDKPVSDRRAVPGPDADSNWWNK